MPPKKGIVKSGNAGNSSKQSKAPALIDKSGSASDAQKEPLFPPGYKYPLSILQERCQKNGWNKPAVHPRKHPDGWAFVVELTRINKKTSQPETVQLEPHPPYKCPTVLEARHWGATYALYRFCNGMSLDRVLPPGPREYWQKLVQEHKSAPEHQQWMWDSDPFAAKKMVEERQAKAAAKKAAEVKQTEASSSSSAPVKMTVAPEFLHAPEVKMASDIRDQVEKAIREAMTGENEEVVQEGDTTNAKLQEEISSQLQIMSFSARHCKNAVEFISQPNNLKNVIFSGLSPLEAAIEYLMIYVPETDLPQRFLPANNSSNSFVSSTHSGVDDLKQRWMEDKAIKESGWPSTIVKNITSKHNLPANWSVLMEMLNRKLLGLDVDCVLSDSHAPTGRADDDSRVQDEIEAVLAVYPESSHDQVNQELVISLPSAPMKLHVILQPAHPYPDSERFPPAYLTSKEAPAYVRLHCLRKSIETLIESGIVGTGEGVCFAMVEAVEEVWQEVQANGSPDIAEIMQHLLQTDEIPAERPVEVAEDEDVAPVKGKRRQRGTYKRRDPRSGQEVLDDYKKMHGKPSYKDVLKKRQQLPAFSVREEFLTVLAKARVVIVAGGTGCGKTTQLPQFILDSLIESGRGASVSIVITQPRRLSAISVAARVSSERLDDGSVGYAIRGESKQDAKTKLLFCTTGVVLRRLSGGDSLNDVTHLIIDEVHERSVDGDFLLMEIRELLKTNTTLKVVLMSATINHETFIEYFNNAPFVYLPGFTHPVADFYLEDFIEGIDFKTPTTKPNMREKEEDRAELNKEYEGKGLQPDTIKTLSRLSRTDRVDYQLVASTVKYAISQSKERGAILIFMPGVQEIRQTINVINESGVPQAYDIYPLHANLSNGEQRVVFETRPRWKIVVATNVAETSITIDDVVCVIDAGKVKEIRFDSDLSVSRLNEIWVSKAAAKQRRGRAGRTRPGVCYKLYTRRREDTFDEFSAPEMLRVPLESVLLTMKVLHSEDDPKVLLRKAVSPPDVSALARAWTNLTDLGAINEEGGLTALGHHLSMMPMDLRLAKMLILGTIFRCLDPILTVVACLSTKPLFLNPQDMRDEAQSKKATFAQGDSDLLTACNAYQKCVDLSGGKVSFGRLRVFCDENFISMAAIREISSLRQDFMSGLSDIGFLPMSLKPSDSQLNLNSANLNLVKGIMTGGLWPNVGQVSLPKSAIKYDRVQAGAVQRENEAKDFKVYDLENNRVFLHPTSALFSVKSWQSPFVVYFQKQMTSKIFLRDATATPMYALLLFGGVIKINHVGGGVTVGSPDGPHVNLRAWPRIGVLANQLRRLLDSRLSESIDSGSLLSFDAKDPVIRAMRALLENDGLSGHN